MLLFFKLKNKKYNCDKKIYLMGILNVTPDSFFDGTKFYKLKSAKKQIVSAGGVIE